MELRSLRVAILVNIRQPSYFFFTFFFLFYVQKTISSVEVRSGWTVRDWPRVVELFLVNAFQDQQINIFSALAQTRS